LSRRFTRTREDFRCDRCGLLITGNGYTNHCPACLWSKHVDDHPGDRSATCRGLMRPVRLLYAQGRFRIEHECTACGLHRTVRTQPNDDLSRLLD